MAGVNVLALLGQFKHSRIANEQTEILSAKLAEGGVLYKKQVFFNFLADIPRIFSIFIPVWLLIKHIDDFNDIDNCDVIVVSGKNMIRYAKHIRKTSFPNAKIVQIGKTYHRLQKQDILLRQYTSRFIPHYTNTIVYNGLISKEVNKEIANAECNKFIKIREIFKGNVISVFIDGKRYTYNLTKSEIEEFAKNISIISNNMKKPLLIYADKNVNKNTISLLKENLDCSYYFYSKRDNPYNNPKVAFIAWGSSYILIGNSINNQSEIISQNKPTYVYTTSLNTNRYLRFIEKVKEIGSIKIIDNKTEILEDYVPQKMNEIDKITEQIKKML